MANSPSETNAPHIVVTKRRIIVVGLLVATIGIGATVTLFVVYPPGDSKSAVEIIRTASTIAIGTGGVAGLLLAALRQQTTEHANADTRKANENARHDAEERRISDLQASAGEQLGNEKAAVRLNGLYQLERLGQNHPEHRQTVINVLCAYLRMPFTHPDTLVEQPEDTRVDTDSTSAREELQVRLTAQRILAEHLRPDIDPHTDQPTNTRFWPSARLDLTGAVLTRFDLSDCQVSRSLFDGARFEGVATFENAHFEAAAEFRRVDFRDPVVFNKANFQKAAIFPGSDFRHQAFFVDAKFNSNSSFVDAHFARSTWFSGALFQGTIWFTNAHIEEKVDLQKARLRWDRDRSRDVLPPGWASCGPEINHDGHTKYAESAWGHIVDESDLNRPQIDNIKDVDRTATRHSKLGN